MNTEFQEFIGKVLNIIEEGDNEFDDFLNTEVADDIFEMHFNSSRDPHLCRNMLRLVFEKKELSDTSDEEFVKMFYPNAGSRRRQYTYDFNIYDYSTNRVISEIQKSIGGSWKSAASKIKKLEQI